MARMLTPSKKSMVTRRMMVLVSLERLFSRYRIPAIIITTNTQKTNKLYCIVLMGSSEVLVDAESVITCQFTSDSLLLKQMKYI
jgi:hypothetical protein